MSTGAVLPPPKPLEKSSGLWSRLKKNLNSNNNAIVVQRRNPLDPRPVNGGGDTMRRNLSEGTFHPSCFAQSNGSSTLGRVQIGKQGPAQQQTSLKSVQLQLAKDDHENNVLNSRPMPKRISVSQSHTQQELRQSTLPLVNGGNRKELRRAATMSTIAAHERLSRTTSGGSYSSHSSGHLSPPSAYHPASISPASRQSRSPLDNQSPHINMAPGTANRNLWGKVRQQYAPTALELRGQPPAPKLTRITDLWETISETVRENGMLELDEPDPRMWWRKVFVSLRKRHGKGMN